MPLMSFLGIKYGVILVLVAMHDEGIATVIFLCNFSTFSDSLLCAMCVGCSVFLSYIDSVSICDGWSRLHLCVIRYLNKPCDIFVVFISIDIRFLHHTQCTCQLLFFWRTENIRYTNLLCCIYYYSTPAFNHPGAIKEKIEAVGAVIEVQ